MAQDECICQRNGCGKVGRWIPAFLLAARKADRGVPERCAKMIFPLLICDDCRPALDLGGFDSLLGFRAQVKIRLDFQKCGKLPPKFCFSLIRWFEVPADGARLVHLAQGRDAVASADALMRLSTVASEAGVFLSEAEFKARRHVGRN